MSTLAATITIVALAFVLAMGAADAIVAVFRAINRRADAYARATERLEGLWILQRKVPIDAAARRKQALGVYLAPRELKPVYRYCALNDSFSTTNAKDIPHAS